MQDENLQHKPENMNLEPLSVNWLPKDKQIIFGGLCAASGITIAIFIPTWIASLIGFGLVGLGASNIAPVLYSVLGRQKVMPTNLAVSAVTTLGYSGILAGPALIGFIAHTTSLSFAFFVVAAMLLWQPVRVLQLNHNATVRNIGTGTLFQRNIFALDVS